MVKEYTNITLKPLNTFGIDVSAARLMEFSGVDDLREIFSRDLGSWYVMGGGSNIIFTGDYAGTLLRPAGSSISVVADEGDTVLVKVAAGAEWDRLVRWSVDNGLWGAENLSGIPGMAGAAPVQNIGAYGVEIKDILESVEVFNVGKRSDALIPAADCELGYRDSIFKRSLRGEAIIVAVNLRLSRKPNPRLGYADLKERVERTGGPNLKNIRKAVIAIRDSKLPDPAVVGNSGSFFKNPVVGDDVVERLKADHPDIPVYASGRAGYGKLAAGWLIDKCGWKGRGTGRVGVHEKQALVLVNLGGATGSEVAELAMAIRNNVFEKFGVELDTEVNIL